MTDIKTNTIAKIGLSDGSMFKSYCINPLDIYRKSTNKEICNNVSKEITNEYFYSFTIGIIKQLKGMALLHLDFNKDRKEWLRIKRDSEFAINYVTQQYELNKDN